MRKSSVFIGIYLFFYLPVVAVTGNDTLYKETAFNLEVPAGTIYGTLTTPLPFKQGPVALLVAGSGPTDRNGNNPYLKNDGLKKLAHQLAENNIATVRYDKRGIAASSAVMTKEADLRFEDYINDVKAWIQLLKKDKRFSKVVVIGHSEGSLLGMVAVNEEGADQFISIAGAGRPAGTIIKEQIGAQSQELLELTIPIVDSLEKGYTVKNVDSKLVTVFRASVQPYLISWFKYDPQQEIKKPAVPVLIIQGTNDIQVPVKDAENLKVAQPNAKLVLIENMNHIFRIVEGDRQANIATYSKQELPVADELITSITKFIASH